MNDLITNLFDKDTPIIKKKYLGINSQCKWSDLQKDIKFKKIKEYLYKKDIKIRITDYSFNNIKYNENTQSITSIQLVKKLNKF